jgi:hypothetical protein
MAEAMILLRVLRGMVIVALKTVWIVAALTICLPVNIIMAWLVGDNIRESVATFMQALIEFVGAQPMVDRVRLWIRALRA